MKYASIILLFSFFFNACKKAEEPKKDGPKAYPVVEVTQKSVTGFTSYPASLLGKINNDVRAKINGYITQVLVDEGQRVSRGQPLFRLETNMLNENASAAQSGIATAEAGISAARAAVNAAQVEVNKLRPLVEKNIISNVQLETAKANLYRAQAQLQQAQATRQQAVANYKSVNANINYSIIRAPISGVIGKINFREGSLVSPNDARPLSTISDTQEIYAYFSMNEKEYLDFLSKSYGSTVPEKLRNLPPVELELANGSIYPEKGRIQTVTGQIDPNTGSIQFRVAFANSSQLLSNGNSGKIRIPKFYDQAIVIPEVSSYEQQGMVYAYKVVKDTAKNTPLKVLDRIDNMILISEGLTKGDKIVASGVGSLKPNTAIKPKLVKFDSLVQSIKPVF